MSAVQTTLSIATTGKGLRLITREVETAVAQLLGSEQRAPGLVHLFLQHTSASLVIQENADPTAKRDLEEFIDRLVPENQSWHRHLDEGADDTVSHMKASITQTSLTLPFDGERLGLGTWQGLYLWEHRRAPYTRKIVITVLN